MGGNAPSVLSPPSLDLKITAPSFIAWAAFRSRRSRRQQARLLFAFREHPWPRVGWAAIMLREKSAAEKIGIIFYSEKTMACAHSVILSPSGKLEEAAQNLFAALREMDACDVAVILAEEAPPVGIGRAINDRLTRASHRR